MAALPGDLGALPLELIWKTLDGLLTESSTLGHDSFCCIRKLGQTNKQAAATIDAYFSLESSVKLLQQAIEADGSFTYSDALHLKAQTDSSDVFKVPAFGVPLDFSACKMAPGLVTGIIKDGCIGCFKQLRKAMPELDGTYVTNRGWVYLAIAVSSESLDMVKYFCSIDSPVPGSLLLKLLTCPANVLYNAAITRTILENIALKKEFGRNLFTFLTPRFEEIKTAAFGGRRAKDQLSLCQFLTPEQAVEFEKIGMPLHNVLDLAPNGGNAYHAAAVNSTDFLNFLNRRSTLSMQEREGGPRTGALPIHHAIRANMVDCVIWFQKYGGADSFGSKQRAWTTGTTADLASRMTSDESVEMLKAILAPLARQKASLGTFFCFQLLTSLTDGLRSHDYDDSRGLTAQELVDLKNKDEERAIKKAKLLLAFAPGSNKTAGVEDGWEKAVSDARGLGFHKLADCIKAAVPSN